MKKINKNKGFTLIEILVVIGIIAILATIVIIAINPSRQFAQARNAQRLSNINTILNAIGQNVADNRGLWSCGNVYFGSATSSIGTSGKDISCLAPTYISAGIPVDPANGTTAVTGYEISTTSSNRFMVCAPNAAEASIPGSVGLCVVR
ncbi:MAG: type II secretion system protein [Minisyncoccia bacterium]